MFACTVLVGLPGTLLLPITVPVIIVFVVPVISLIEAALSLIFVIVVHGRVFVSVRFIVEIALDWDWALVRVPRSVSVMSVLIIFAPVVLVVVAVICFPVVSVWHLVVVVSLHIILGRGRLFVAFTVILVVFVALVSMVVLSGVELGFAVVVSRRLVPVLLILPALLLCALIRQHVIAPGVAGQGTGCRVMVEIE